MIREISRPSTAHRTLPMYAGFLFSEPKSVNCCRLEEIMTISHDSMNRFLHRESYTGRDLSRWLSGAEAGIFTSTPLSERLNLTALAKYPIALRKKSQKKC